MSITVSRFLRNVLHADAAFSAVGALLMLVGAPFVAPLTGLPSSLLMAAGLLLIPYVALLMFLARRQTVSRLAIVDVIAINALWVVASIGLLVSGYIVPNGLGIAFVLAQAAVVAILAELQFVALRRNGVATA